MNCVSLAVITFLFAIHQLSEVLSVTLSQSNSFTQSCDGTNECPMANTFLYFAYGSNLLAKRIHINSPSAVRVTTGKLEGYRLDFDKWSRGWGGCSATIVPDDRRHVWGTVWEIHSGDLPSLDNQEGVATGWYHPIQVKVATPDGDWVACRSYQMGVDAPPALADGEKIPERRRPSPLYREVIIQGALESGLPEEYIEKLKEIPDNGFIGENHIGIDLPIIHPSRN